MLPAPFSLGHHVNASAPLTTMFNFFFFLRHPFHYFMLSNHLHGDLRLFGAILDVFPFVGAPQFTILCR